MFIQSNVVFTNKFNQPQEIFIIFSEKLIDPTVDMTTANWSVFQQSQWVMPLLTELNDLRYVARTIQRDIYSKSDDMDVLFLCDFPGNTNAPHHQPYPSKCVRHRYEFKIRIKFI